MRKTGLRTTLVLAVVAALAAGSLAGCARLIPTADPALRTLVVAVASELDGTDVQQVWTANIVQELISPAPVVFDLKRERLVPQVASGVSFSQDGKSIILTFPRNLRFANGREATGADIEASIERYRGLSPYAADWEDMERVTVDGQTVTLTFRNPPANFLAVLTSVYSGLVDVQEATRVGNEAFNRRAIGIGPYLLKEWVQGSHFTFTRNEHYRDHKPFVQNRGPWHFDTVTVRVIPDGFTRLAELEAGNVDFADIALEHRDRVAANPNLVLLAAPAAGQTYLRFNLHRAPFNDLKFREAINYAINKDAIKQALDAAVEPIYGLLSPAQLAFNAAVEAELEAKRGHNLARAQQLLTELGYVPGADGILRKGGQPLRLTLLVPNDVAVQRLAGPVVQAQLRAIGIDVALEEQGRAYVRELVRANNYDIAFQAWNWADPDIWYFSFHSSNANPIWSTPQVDAILEAGRTTMDMVQRAAKYGELSRLVGEHLPIISLFYPYTYRAHRRTLQGLHIGVDGTVHFNDARKVSPR